jgi:hypothetical protein
MRATTNNWHQTLPPLSERAEYYQTTINFAPSFLAQQLKALIGDEKTYVFLHISVGGNLTE